MTKDVLQPKMRRSLDKEPMKDWRNQEGRLPLGELDSKFHNDVEASLKAAGLIGPPLANHSSCPKLYHMTPC